jgi:diguanylate cyclase (GGDEF)-like protein
MSNAQLLLAVILIQQGLFGVVWAAAARLHLARRPARHWAACTWLVAAGMALILARGQMSPWLTVTLANALLIGSFAALRRGLQVFGRIAPTDREHLAVVLVAAGGFAVAVALGDSLLPVVLLSALGTGWTLLRAAAEVRRALVVEFGAQTAHWCAVPLAGVGTVFLLRGLMAPFFAAQFASSIAGPAAGNTAVVFASLVFGLVLHTTLIAMVVIRLVRRLQYQSDHDALTGLRSRRAMTRLLEAEAQRQRRFGGGYAILSIDIDHFKRINDRYGHAAGDAVLARVAQALEAATREVDRVARMGGEEFCVLLPGTDRSGAEQAAQRLLEAVRRLHHPEADATLKVTVSIGVAVVGAEAEPLPALLRRLDQALYAAKAAGRDRVEHATAGLPG